MKVNKASLEQALEIVKPGLASKEIIDQTTSFAFLGDRVVTYNDEISISHPVEGLNITGAVKADRLYGLLKKIKLKKDDTSIDIAIEDNQIVLSYLKMKAGLVMESEIKIPTLIKEVKRFPIPEKLMEAIKFTAPACSHDMSRPVLTCVHINENGFIEASDSYRIARYDIGSEMPIKTFLLPQSSALELIKFQATEIGIEQGWIHFYNTENGALLKCRILADEFPDITPILKDFSKGTVEIVFPNTIQKILDRAAVFSKQDHFLDEVVTITVGDSKFKVSSKGENDWFEEETHSTYKDKEITFAVTPQLLKGILKDNGKCELANNKLKFTGENWIFITLLRTL